MAWITNRGLYQEAVIDPHTGLKKIVSVKISGTSEKAKQEAYKKLQERIKKLDDPHVKLTAAIDTYIKESSKDLKPSSIRKMTVELEQFVKIVGDADMSFLTAGYIRKKLLDSGKENRTLNGYMKIFKTFWLWAYRNDYVSSREVFDKLQYFNDTPEKERIQDKYLETKELKLLIDSMKETRWKLVTEFLALTGLRIGELVALKETDVWGNIIRINKTYDANNKVITSAKTYSSKRDIHIQTELKDCIDRIREYTAWQKEVFGYESDIFFPDTDGDYLKYHTYRKYLMETAEKLFSKRVTPHVLRHTHCSMLAMSGMSLDSIANRLGHEDSKITKEIYFHRLEELKEKENRQLDGIRLLS
jgi:integrase